MRSNRLVLRPRRVLIISFLLLFFLNVRAQNSPFFIWGSGLNGSTYQTAAIYSGNPGGLGLEAPLEGTGLKLPMRFGWRGGDIAMKILPNGNVGVGTDSPVEKLDVNGRINAGDRIYASSSNINALSLIQSYNSVGGASVLRTYSGSSYWDFAANQNAGGNTLFIGQGIDVSVGNAAIAILSNNNVGIGTNDPKGYKLAVNGKIRSQEIKVEANNWPDYVFTKDYQLPPLLETEKYIKDKGHLPGIPSAAEAESNGINLGEMNAKLLQKIEELTLHLIKENKENKNNQERLKEQDLRLTEQTNKLKQQEEMVTLLMKRLEQLESNK